MSYRIKIIVAIAFISIIMLGLLITNRITLERTLFEDKMLIKVDSLGEIFTEEVHNYSIKEKHDNILRILDLFDKQPGIEFALIADGKNIIKYSSIRELINKPNFIKDSENIRKSKNDVFIKSFPLHAGDSGLKYVQIGFSLKEIKADLRKSFFLSLNISIITLFLVLFVAWLISGILLKPLIEMQKNADNIANGDYSKRIPVRSDDVIGKLAFSMNNMAAYLDDLTKNLNKKIQDATRELEITNNILIKKTELLEESNRKLTELDKLKSEFVSIVSHELRTPLTGIIGFAQTILRLKLPKEQEVQYLKIIETEGKRLGKLIDDFLDISKIEAGNFGLHFEDVNISELVKETVDSIKLSHEIQIKTNLPDKILFAEADRDRIKQVMMNIIGNAIKYTSAGGKIVVELKDFDDSINISIEDNGPGIKKEEYLKIFEKFYRGHDNITKKNIGSGLGLTIAKGIINAHKGEIWVESESGKGSKFSFTLPKKQKKNE
ncbi:MAG: hypothetical protein A2539_08080 [Elusimicrobia bacterium RIFOXYD2_FULL_34_15]|nr:MAG: hypothetical protein A2539_08080 [Elusimicrobia bacterium RIFOXYD2_FULL_34_15]